MCVFAVSSCTSNLEEIEISTMEGEMMKFSVGASTRLNTKESWVVGDEVAVYRKGTDAPKFYTIADESGNLASDDGWEYNTDYYTYAAICPYESGMSYSDYISQLSIFSDTDIIKTGYTDADNQVLKFSFSHAYAIIKITNTAVNSSDNSTIEFTATIKVNEDTIDRSGSSIEFFILGGNYTDKFSIYATVEESIYDYTIGLSDYIFVGGIIYEIGINIK